MKIKSIYISAFGKLKDFTLDLSDGFNVVFGENENGKSTVMAFIRMMFYGTEGKRAHNLSSKPRIKYAPWDNSLMGGRIDFEHSGRHYRLEREFKRSDATDRISLTDLDLGLPVKLENGLGYNFFGISAAAFDRSVFIDNMGAVSHDQSAESELNSKLSNTFVTGEEDVSYQEVVNNLLSGRNKLISKGGRTGDYLKKKAYLEELEERFERSLNDAKIRAELSLKSENLKAEYEQTKTEYDRLKEKILSEQTVKDAKKLKEYLDFKEKLDSLNETAKLSDGSFADEMFVKKVYFCLNKLEMQQKRTLEVGAEYEKIREEIDLSDNKNGEDLNKKISDSKEKLTLLLDKKDTLSKEILQGENLLEEARENKENLINNKSALNLPLFITGLAVALVLGVVLSVAKMFLGAAVSAVIGVILIILSLVLKPSNRSAVLKAEAQINSCSSLLAKLKTDFAVLEGEITSETANQNLITAAITMNQAQKERRLLDLEEKKVKLEEEREKENSLLKDLITLYGRYEAEENPEIIRSKLVSLEEKAEEIKAVKLRLKYLSADLGGISYEEARAKLDGISSLYEDGISTDFEGDKIKLDALNEKLSVLRSSITETLTKLKAEFKTYEEPENIKKEIDEVKEITLSQKEFCDSADIAVGVLEESFAEVRRNYGSALEKKTLSIFSRLTNGRYRAFNISKAMDITVEPSEFFGTREVEYLSSGTVDQAYLSLRLALSKLISENEPLPVILDDVLSQYDDIRTKEALTFLKEYSADNQVILFTCHGFVKSSAKDMNIDVKSLLSKN